MSLFGFDLTEVTSVGERIAIALESIAGSLADLRDAYTEDAEVVDADEVD